VKIKLDGVILYLGKLRKDGRRNVERIRFNNWRLILPKLRDAKVPAKMVGKRLTVRLDEDSQPTLAFMDAG
jgi:hypothetical protein